MALAQVYVQPYVDNQGNFHQGHMRSAPDSNPYNNYSTRGNVNPYTGQAGTVNPQPGGYHAPAYNPPPQPQQYMPQQYNPPGYQQRRSAY